MKREAEVDDYEDRIAEEWEALLKALREPAVPSSLGPKPPQCGRRVPRCPSLDELEKELR